MEEEELSLENLTLNDRRAWLVRVGFYSKQRKTKYDNAIETSSVSNICSDLDVYNDEFFPSGCCVFNVDKNVTYAGMIHFCNQVKNIEGLCFTIELNSLSAMEIKTLLYFLALKTKVQIISICGDPTNAVVESCLSYLDVLFRYNKCLESIDFWWVEPNKNEELREKFMKYSFEEYELKFETT